MPPQHGNGRTWLAGVFTSLPQPVGPRPPYSIAAPTITTGTTSRITFPAGGVACAAAPRADAVATLETLVYPVQVFPLPWPDADVAVVPPAVTVPAPDEEAAAVPVADAAVVAVALLDTGVLTVPMPDTLAVPAATPATIAGDAQSHTGVRVSDVSICELVQRSLDHECWVRASISKQLLTC